MSPALWHHSETTPPNFAPAVVIMAVVVSWFPDSRTFETIERIWLTAFSNSPWALRVTLISFAVTGPEAGIFLPFWEFADVIEQDRRSSVSGNCSPPQRRQVERRPGRQQPEQGRRQWVRPARAVAERGGLGGRQGVFHARVGHQEQGVAARARRDLRPDQRAVVGCHADQRRALRARGHARGADGGRLAGRRYGEDQAGGRAAGRAVLRAGDRAGAGKVVT